MARRRSPSISCSSRAINRLGKVDDGTAHLDYEPEEQKRRESLSLAVATFEHDSTGSRSSTRPATRTSSPRSIQGFQPPTAHCSSMDASGGVEAGLENAVALGRSTGRGCVLRHQQVRPGERGPDRGARRAPGGFGNKIAPLHVAIGAGESFEGYVDLVHRKAYRFDGGTEVEIPIPDELADEVATRRDQLLEAAAEADDDVLTKYLEGEEISDAELDACLHSGVRDSILAPVLVGSAAKGIGIDALLDAFIRYLPSPAEERPPARRKNGEDVEVAPGSDGPLARPRLQDRGRPVRRPADVPPRPHRARSSAGPRLEREPRRGRADRPAAAAPRQGPGADRRAEAGEIGAVAKLTVTETGDTLSTQGEAAHACRRSTFPEPTLPFAIEPQTKADLDKMGPALQRMLEEEPTARVERSRDRRAAPAAQGETHVAVIAERLKRKFGAAIVTRTPKVPYRETIRGTTKVHGRYKKQTGGHGMFGDVWLELEPNPGGGVEFAEKVVGGSVPRQFFPGVEKGIRETAAEGVVAGYPAHPTSRRPSTTARSTRSTRTSCRSRSRPRWRSRTASTQAKPALLEPIMTVEIRVPEAFMGEVNRDLNGAPRPRAGHGHRRTGMQVITRARPAGRAVHLRHGAALTDRWPGHVQRDARPLRGRARRTSPRRSSRSTRRTRATERPTPDRPTLRRAPPPRDRCAT